MKVLRRIVDGLMSIDDLHSGFVPERHYIVVHRMQVKCLAVNKHIYMAFLALEKAFNCVPRICLSVGS